MSLTGDSKNGWLAFELSVLNRLRFSSVAIPFVDRPVLAGYLKQAGVKVFTNSLLRSSYASCLATVKNDGDSLTADDTAIVLEDAYVPQYRLSNQELRNWFNETDAWWFDNVRANIERLTSDNSKAIALSVGMKVGDYVLSFDQETSRLRQPLSKVFERLLMLEQPAVSNGEENTCRCSDPIDFIAESYTDLFFLRLPAPRRGTLRQELGKFAWKECWVRGEGGFWGEIEQGLSGKLGARVETKTQYLELLRRALETAGHIKKWAIEHVENGFVPTQEVVDVIGSIRKVDTVYTKDFSELTGVKAVMITA
ncbi:MAG: hypothetical protein DWQ47_16175 [Acidobacteria bacterium]|nr:MAG: hypothetical protein DWQ32_03575 [Acidobacteriota bacterium]REK02409.1 MAG: hypothetical protein DWQ38_08560 [Acidobacteriota bacterium]REK13789.1 MAG: hypothetical protein DWQ43_09265 [Acidobacteriota bacterium]REK41783.1 MAG: hypothetical protein DWQ47_16175 [Acidobacteriota bacterium]